MNVKKLALIGAIALVVLGCVVAAGCTSTTTTQQTVSDDKILGAWTHTTDEDVAVVVMMEGGKGYYIGLAKETTPLLLKHSPLKWTWNDDGTITHNSEYDLKPLIMTYDAEKDIFNDDHGYTLTRVDPVTGIWFNEGTLNGKKTKFSNIFMLEGTGVLDTVSEDGTVKVIESTWKKNEDGTYTVTYADGFTNTLNLDDTKNILRSATATNGTLTKKFADSYYYLSILGPWYNEEYKCLHVFSADGTFSTYLNKEKMADGTWEVKDLGTIVIHITAGKSPSGQDISGMDTEWTFDKETVTITADGGKVFVRPSTDVGNLTYVKFN